MAEREPKVRWITETEAADAALKDAASGIPNPDDPSATPAFTTDVMTIARKMQSALVAEYSARINLLDSTACKYIDELESDRAARTRAWEERFSSHVRNPFWYWFALLVVFGADIAVNSYVFQSWGDTDDISLFIAIVVGVALLVVAKFTAWSLRSGPSLTARVFGGAMLLLPLVILYLISVNRYDAMAAEGRTVGNSVWLYYALNLLFLGAGFLLSFFKETRLEKLQRRLTETTQKRQEIFEAHATKAADVLNRGVSLVHEYRQTNDRAQKTVCKWENPVAHFPTCLTRLHEPHAAAQNTVEMTVVDFAGQPVGPSAD
jgi:hypothetical protein